MRLVGTGAGGLETGAWFSEGGLPERDVLLGAGEGRGWLGGARALEGAVALPVCLTSPRTRSPAPPLLHPSTTSPTPAASYTGF